MNRNYIDEALGIIQKDKISAAAPILIENYTEGVANEDIAIFMLTLLKFCNKNQHGKVNWLFDECMKRFSPFLMEKLLIAKMRMCIKFRNNFGLKSCYRYNKCWLEKGWLRPTFDYKKELEFEPHIIR